MSALAAEPRPHSRPRRIAGRLQTRRRRHLAPSGWRRPAAGLPACETAVPRPHKLTRSCRHQPWVAAPRMPQMQSPLPSAHRHVRCCPEVHIMIITPGVDVHLEFGSTPGQRDRQAVAAQAAP